MPPRRSFALRHFCAKALSSRYSRLLPRLARVRQCEIPLPVLKESHTATLKEIGENGA